MGECCIQTDEIIMSKSCFDRVIDQVGFDGEPIFFRISSYTTTVEIRESLQLWSMALL
jgi:hypothetical protein